MNVLMESMYSTIQNIPIALGRNLVFLFPFNKSKSLSKHLVLSSLEFHTKSIVSFQKTFNYVVFLIFYSHILQGSGERAGTRKSLHKTSFKEINAQEFL